MNISAIKFRKFILLISVVLIMQTAGASGIQTAVPLSPAIGRWDITINLDSNKQEPSWMEIYLSGNTTLVGQFVGSGGSARPIAQVFAENNSLSFSIPTQWDKDTNDLKLQGTIRGDNINGTITLPNGKTYQYTAVRAPSLKRTKQPMWGKKIQLLSNNDLSGWHAMGKNQWLVENGILSSPHSGTNLVTDNSYTDFKLHIEFRYPANSNSGVYLRGRYEVQVEDGDTSHPTKDRLGAVYGFLEPSEDAGKKPGEWQSYDITLVGRMVTVELNGKTIICNREIPGITGGALNSNEGEAGPLMLQGDHGPIEYRNTYITPAQ